MRRIFTFWLAKLLWTYSFTHTVRNFVKSDIELFEVNPFNQVTEIVGSDYFVGVLLLCLPTRRSIFKFVMTQHQSFIYTVKFSVYLTAMTLPSAMNLAVIVLHFFCMRFARHTCADIDHVLERLQLALSLVVRPTWTFAFNLNLIFIRSDSVWARLRISVALLTFLASVVPLPLLLIWSRLYFECR